MKNSREKATTRKRYGDKTHRTAERELQHNGAKGNKTKRTTVRVIYTSHAAMWTVS